MEPIDFGSINQGDYVVLTFTFKQSGTPADPSGGAFVNMTPPGGSKTSYTTSLNHTGAGIYTLAFTGTTPGPWTGTAYAPPGTGQATQRFEIFVDPDPNAP